MSKYWRAYARAFMASAALLMLVGAGGPACANEAAEAPESEGEAAKEGPVAPGFFPVPDLNVLVVKQNRVRGVLAVKLVLDIEKQDAMDQAGALLPRLSADYSSALAKWSNTFQNLREPANVTSIKQQLQLVTNRVMGREDVSVLLQRVLLRADP